MSKKLFSLLFGDNVHVAPQTKIIKAKEFSKSLDIDQMIHHVKEEEKKYRTDVVTECEQIKEQAYREGFESGYLEWTKQLSFLENETFKLRSEIEKILAPVALKAAQKIVGKELETSNEVVIDIISNVLKTVSQHKKIAIYANPKDIEILEKNRPRIKKIFESLEALSLRPQDDIEQGGCIIETEGGIINARMDNQWMVLEQAFESFFAKKSLETLKEEVK